MSGARKIVVLGSNARSLIDFRGQMLSAMVERGHRVVACAPAARAMVVDALATLGVTYRDVSFKPTGMRPDEDLRTLSAFVKLFRETRPDVLLGYTIKPVIYGLLAARLTGVPQRFAMITGLGYSFVADGLKAQLAGAAARRLYRISLAGANRVFFQNPDDRALFEQWGLVRRSGQIVMINGSGIDLDFFRPTPLPAKGVSFLLIARLLREKGIREYVEAARKVHAKYPHASFHLVGRHDEGNPAGIPEREVQAWVAEGVVQYHGMLQDVRPALTETSVYVLPSYREGTPRTVLEAMAMGRPIVTTDVPGCRETVVQGVNGYLVPVRDADALAETMERFLVEPGLIPVMGRESRRIAEEKYDVHEVNRVILQAMRLDG